MKVTVDEIARCIYKWIEIDEGHNWSGPCHDLVNLEEVAQKIIELVEEKEKK